jgi:DNA-binding winged helix-turn-helix (wHTH) protein
MRTEPGIENLCFGEFELEVGPDDLRRNGRRVKLQPQPARLLTLLARRAGALVTRDEIRRELWPEGTFVDFDQSVNFAIRQIREVLNDAADRPMYVETVPKRGYRFIAPVERRGGAAAPPATDQAPAAKPAPTTSIHLQKALWTNIAELRMAERRQRVFRWATVVGILVIASLLLLLIVS